MPYWRCAQFDKLRSLPWRKTLWVLLCVCCRFFLSLLCLYLHGVGPYLLAVHLERTGCCLLWPHQSFAASCTVLSWHAIIQGAGAMGLIVLLVSGELAPTNVLGFCIASSNAVGLLGGLFLLGYGLIAIPKQAC